MKRISIIVTVIVAAFILVNCQKEIIDANTKVDDEKQAIERTSRISFVKSGNVKGDEKQQDFKLHYVERRWVASNISGEYVEKQSKTEIVFLVEYKTGDEYKLHNFDVAWNGKLNADSDGKLWMDLNVFHKTFEKDAKNTMVDSAVVVIPDIEKFNIDTISKLWLRFVNTSDTKNVLTLQYQKQESSDDSSSTTTGNSDNSGTEADDGSSETNVQDSTNTGSTSGTSTDDEDNSGSSGTDDNSSGTTSQDSTNIGSNTGTTTSNDDNSGATGPDDDSSGTTSQDSTNVGSSTGTTNDNSGSTGTDEGNSETTVQDSTGGSN